MNNLYGIIVSFIFVALIIGASSLLRSCGVISGEGSRKLIHIGVCNWWLIAMMFFNKPIYAAFVPAVFIAVNYLSYKKQLIKAMERNSGTKDLGTVYYAISLFILALITFREGGKPFVGALGILVMGYGDGLAALVGEKLGKRPFGPERNHKTLEGTLAMFLASFLVIFIVVSAYSSFNPFIIGFVLAVYATIAELYTPNGFDNLTVPLGTSILYTIISVVL